MWKLKSYLKKTETKEKKRLEQWLSQLRKSREKEGYREDVNGYRR